MCDREDRPKSRTSWSPRKRRKLRQAVSNVLYNTINKKNSNLTNIEKKGLKYLKEEVRKGNLAITSQDKGLGFVTLTPSMLHKKAMEAFKNIKPENKDKTKSLEQKIQKKLLELKKKE